MAYNGFGTFNPLASPNYPAVAGEVIYAARFNAVINDILTGLSNCVTRDGQGKFATDVELQSLYKLKHSAVATEAGDALIYGQSSANLTSLTLGTALGTWAFSASPTVPTGVDRTGGSSAASQQYVEVAVARGISEAPLVTTSLDCLAILTFIGA